MRRLRIVVGVVLVLATGQTATADPGPQTAAAPGVGGDVHDAAETLYGGDNPSLTRVEAGPLPEAFPSLEIYYVVNGEGLPGDTHIMAWDGTQSKHFDLTTQFNDILAHVNALIATSADAFRYSGAYAQAANAEVQVVREVVDSTDSERLGVPIADPEATPILGGWEVTVPTWAFQNGVLGTWTITLSTTAVQTGIWRIDDIAVGPSGMYLRGVAFQPGVRITNSYSGGYSRSVVLETPQGDEPMVYLDEHTGFEDIPGVEATNFDGSRWQASSYTPLLIEDDIDFAQHLVEGGRLAYNKQVASNPSIRWDPATQECRARLEPTDPLDPFVNPNPNLGFAGQDPDCRLDLVLIPTQHLQSLRYTGTAKAVTPQLPETIIVIHARLREHLAAHGFYTDPTITDAQVAEVIMAHEHLHVLQYQPSVCSDDTPCTPFRHVLEGTARFIETILTPTPTQAESSLWYGTTVAANKPVGVNYFQTHPHLSMCGQGTKVGTPTEVIDDPVIVGGTGGIAHEYDYALYFGYLYDQDGGPDTIRAIIEEVVAEHQKEVDGVRDPITFEDCNQRVAEAIDRVLVAHAGAHDSHADALVDFGVAMYLRDFFWPAFESTDDLTWGEHLLPAATEPQDLVSGAFQEHDVGAWGLQFVELPTGISYQVSFDIAQGDSASGWRAQVVRVDAKTGQRRITALSPTSSETIDTGDSKDAFIQVVRANSAPSSYLLAVSTTP